MKYSPTTKHTTQKTNQHAFPNKYSFHFLISSIIHYIILKLNLQIHQTINKKDNHKPMNSKGYSFIIFKSNNNLYIAIQPFKNYGIFHTHSKYKQQDHFLVLKQRLFAYYSDHKQI